MGGVDKGDELAYIDNVVRLLAFVQQGGKSDAELRNSNIII